MRHLTVAGLQWGDEGKGKIVDIFAAHYDVIIRFQGGHNAGHTLVIDGKTFKLSLLPSGIVREDKICVIGNGVVLDAAALAQEIAAVRQAGIKIDAGRLKIAENTPLILPLHSYIENRRGAAETIGTTARGIGPAYEDKVARRSIRVCDLADENLLYQKIKSLAEFHNCWLKGAGTDAIDIDENYQAVTAHRELLLEFSVALWPFLRDRIDSGKRFLFEGAQGMMLDIDHGTYPYVTSSNTIASAVSAGSGVMVDSYRLGVAKAYCTRVGHGLFPTEDTGADGTALAERGHEFGTVTGRKRRCGWFDVPLMRQAATVSGIHGLVLTKIDVLDEFDTLKICTGYHYHAKALDYLPAGLSARDDVRLEPVYQTYPGWRQELRGCKTWQDLPANAQNFITAIEQLTQLPVVMVSTGPERKDVFWHDKPDSLPA